MGASGASAPPASITSARPARIVWNASPTAIVPEAQLMALVELGPVKPNSMAMLQLAAPGNTASASAGSSPRGRSEEHTSELQSRLHLVCRLLLEKKKQRVRPRAEHHEVRVCGRE